MAKNYIKNLEVQGELNITPNNNNSVSKLLAIDDNGKVFYTTSVSGVTGGAPIVNLSGETLHQVTSRGNATGNNVLFSGTSRFTGALVIPSVNSNLNGALYIGAPASTGNTAPLVSSIFDLEGTQFTNLSVGQGIIWNGSNFVNQNISVDLSSYATKSFVTSQGYLTGYTETDTLQSVTDRGTSTNKVLTVSGLTTSGTVNVAGGTLLIPTGTTATMGALYIAAPNSTGNTAPLVTSFTDLEDVDSSAIANNRILRYNSTTGKLYFTDLNIDLSAYSTTVQNDGKYYPLSSNPAGYITASSITWANLLNKPTTVAGYGITDAMTTAHSANGITSTNITNWNTAYTNNHTHSNKTVLDGITSALVTNWNTGYAYSQFKHLPLSGGTVTGTAKFTGTLIIPTGSTSAPGALYLGTPNSTGTTIGGGGAGDLTKVQADTYYLGITATAANSTKWNGWAYAGDVPSPSYLLGFNGTSWGRVTQGNVKSYLGLGSAASASTTDFLDVNATAANSFKLNSYDSRTTNHLPTDRNVGVYADFRANTTDGLSNGGTYHGVLTFRPYGSTTDTSGGGTHQLGFTEGGNLYYRRGAASWGAWNRLAFASELNSYLPFTGGTLTGTLNGTVGYFGTASNIQSWMRVMAQQGMGAMNGSKGIYLYNDGISNLKIDAYDWGTTTALDFTLGGNGGSVNVATALTVAGSAVITAGNIGSQSVNYATSAGSAPANGGTSTFTNYINGTYTGNGGSEPPSYIPSGKIRFNMMRVNPNNNTGNYVDWMMMDTYAGSDVPYVTMIGVQKASGSPAGYLAVGAKNGTTWSTANIITSANIGSQSVSSATSAGNADTVDGYHASNFLGKNGNTYYQADVWIQSTSTHGLYLPNSGAGTHWGANIAGAYGSFRMDGKKGTYQGIELADSNTVVGMFDDNGNGGNYNATGGWHFYWNRAQGSLGIGGSSTSGSYRAYVNGALYATGDIVAYSDRRKKENIVTIDNALEKVSRLRGVNYTMKNGDGSLKMGVIAQETAEVLPEVVTYSKDTDEYGVSYGNIVGVLIEAIKELTAKVEELEGRAK